jgi:hypothetical protein
MDKLWRGKVVITETTGARHMERIRIQGKIKGDRIYW